MTDHVMCNYENTECWGPGVPFTSNIMIEVIILIIIIIIMVAIRIILKILVVIITRRTSLPGAGRVISGACKHITFLAS